MATPHDWLEYAKIDPELDQFIKKKNGGKPPKLGGTIHGLRAQLAQAKAALNATQGPDNTTGVREEDITIEARDGFSIPARIHAPEKPHAGGSPLVVMLHGGGWCLGGLENEELNCRNFAQRLGCVCLNVDYRLAPEHPFPAAVNDSWDALKWAAKNAKSLGADPRKGSIVGGTSAGGNLATVTALLARDDKLSPPLTGVLLMIPVLLDPTVVPAKYKPWYQSYEQNKDAAVLPVSAMSLFKANYKPEPSSPLYSPILHPKGHGGLPPIYFQVCGMDPLRDEALIYERILREEYGGRTKLDVYQGVPHGFWSFFPTLKVSTRFVEDTVKGLVWLLQEGRSEDRLSAKLA